MATETDSVRVWLVERGYTSRDLVVLQYATPDGDRVHRRELSAQALDGASVTAARDVSPDDLESVDDPETRDRYAAEAERMAEEHDPGDPV